MRTFQKKSLLLIFLVTLSGISGGLASAQSDRDENKFESSDIIGIDENLDTPVNEYIDTIFRSDSLFINNDFAWDNQLINSGHFDSKNMTDTVRFLIGARSSHEFFVAPYTNYVTCGFGYRRYLFHFGIDVKLEKGDSVKAAFDGIVRVTKYDRRGFGNVVVIRHEKGLETIYGHLSKTFVTSYQKIKAGDLIGLGGNTGRSTGSHLHFETRYMGEPFDPGCFYDFTNHVLLSDTLMLTKRNFEYLVELRKEKFLVIRKGDTLSTIARQCHTTVSTLCRLNHISTKTILRVGRPLRYI